MSDNSSDSDEMNLDPEPSFSFYERTFCGPKKPFHEPSFCMRWVYYRVRTDVWLWIFFVYNTLFYLLLKTYMCLLDKSGMRWALWLIFVLIRIVFCIFFNHFEVITGAFFRVLVIVHEFFFQDRFWVRLGRAIVEHFVSRVNSYTRRKKRYPLRKNCSAWTIPHLGTKCPAHHEGVRTLVHLYTINTN